MSEQDTKSKPGFWKRTYNWFSTHDPYTMVLSAIGGSEAKKLAKQSEEAHVRGDYKEGRRLANDADSVAITHIVDSTTGKITETAKQAAATAVKFGKYLVTPSGSNPDAHPVPRASTPPAKPHAPDTGNHKL